MADMTGLDKESLLLVGKYIGFLKQVQELRGSLSYQLVKTIGNSISIFHYYTEEHHEIVRISWMSKVPTTEIERLITSIYRGDVVVKAGVSSDRRHIDIYAKGADFSLTTRKFFKDMELMIKSLRHTYEL